MMKFLFVVGSGQKVVLIAVAGRSNGLGPVLSGNSVFPVINCPPVKSDNVSLDIWSSVNTPSGNVNYYSHSTVILQSFYLHVPTHVSH